MPVVAVEVVVLSEEDCLAWMMLEPAGRGGFMFFRDLSVLIEGEVARREAREWRDAARWDFSIE